MDKGLLISIRNVGLKAKNSKARLQEGVLKKTVDDFTSSLQLWIALGVSSYDLKYA